MATNYFKVRIIEKGKERNYDYYNSPWMAVGFAQGYAQCLAEECNIQMMTPHVPQLDGYHWWSNDENVEIQVLDSNNEPFTGQ